MQHSRTNPAIFLSLLLCATGTRAEDVENGMRVFEAECAACHEIGGQAQTKIGPALTAFYGGQAAQDQGFAYSANLRTLAEGGLIWDEPILSAYVQSPKKIVPCGKKAIFGLKDSAELSALLMFLSSEN